MRKIIAIGPSGSEPIGERIVVSMRIHRWWLALAAALLTPWIGPHINRYLPVGWALLQASGEATDAAFWVIAAVRLDLGYGDGGSV